MCSLWCFGNVGLMCFGNVGLMCFGDVGLMCFGGGDALLSCQVEQLKEELTLSQSEKEELRQRANELQREVPAVRDTPVCLCALLTCPSSVSQGD